jgi:LysM repeat protein
MAKGQYTFKDFLRERGEDELIESDPVVTGNVLREIKMGLSAMVVLVLLIVVLFHDDAGEKEPAGKNDATQAVQLTVHPAPVSVSASAQTAGAPQKSLLKDAAAQNTPQIGAGLIRQALPPTPALQDRRPGNDGISAAGPATPAQEFRTYKVAPGDTLEGIAAKNYGSGRYWQKLAAFNAISDPARLRVGQQLKLPPAEILDKTPSLSQPAPRNSPPSDRHIDGPRRTGGPCI